MTVTYVEISGSDGEKFPLLQLDRTRDGLATYCETRWPLGRRKAVAKEWGLSTDEARSVCEGSASQATLDKVWRHPRGGWTVLLPVMGAVIGQPIHEFFRQQMRQAAKDAERAQHHEQLAQAAYRRLAGDPSDPGPDRGPRSGARALGAEMPRRVARLT
jgi:hypothetical protein